MTEKELLNEIDHYRRALNSERANRIELERQLNISRQLLKIQRQNTSYWREVAIRLRSNITALLTKYKQEALEHEEV